MLTIGCWCSCSYLRLKYSVPVLVPRSQARMLWNAMSMFGWPQARMRAAPEALDDRLEQRDLLRAGALRGQVGALVVEPSVGGGDQRDDE